MYHYETHLHTFPVSRCAQAEVLENLQFYKALGYDGVFVTNHFLDGNINVDPSLPYAEKIAFYFSDYENAVRLGAQLGIRVFCGVELSCFGMDFLVYGLDKAWFLAHPEIMEMDKSRELRLMMENGALVIHAHPFRGGAHIAHVLPFSQCVHGVEVINASRSDGENEQAQRYALEYGLLEFAGSDNHLGARQEALSGMCSETPIRDEADFVARVKAGQMALFARQQR